MRMRLLLWLLLPVFTAMGLCAGIVALVVLQLSPESHQALMIAVGEVTGLLIFAVIFAVGVLLYWRYRQFQGLIRGGSQLIEALRAVGQRGAKGQLPADLSYPLNKIAETVGKLISHHRQQQSNVEQDISAATHALASERNRMGTLMAVLDRPVLVCNGAGRIVLYNERAQRYFAEHASGLKFGLGFSLYNLLGPSSVEHALTQSRRAENGEAAVVIPDVAGRLTRARFSKIPNTEEAEGWVVTLEDMSRRIARSREREALLGNILEQSRQRLDSISETLEKATGGDGEDPLASIAGELTNWREQLEQVTEHAGEALRTRWPLEVIGLGELLAATRSAIATVGAGEPEIDLVTEGLWLDADSYALSQALADYSRQQNAPVGLLKAGLHHGGSAFVDLTWSDATVDATRLDSWRREPIESCGGHCFDEILAHHDAQASQIANGSSSTLRLLLPGAQGDDDRPWTQTARNDARPVYFDFDLLADSAASKHHGSPADADLLARPLSRLHLTVFDTETTGLDPQGGDEIIAIGAAHIINGKLLESERYTALLNPGRKIKPESQAIHGISDGMLADKPNAASVLPEFHSFCDNTVLLGHNVAFDLRFLKLKEQDLGLRFDRPVLDTLLLAELAMPDLASHKLDHLAEVVGVRVVNRHSALGDALATGEVFLHLIALLKQRGIETLGQALEASKESSYARLRY